MQRKDILLIVDDVKMNRAILKGIFESQYRSMEAQNGEQALRLMEEYRSRIALVLLDLSMPIMDGFQVMREMNRRGFLSSMPVIIITADDSADAEIRAFDTGASDVICKPFEAHIVRRRVQNVLELTERRLLQDELIEEQASKLRRSNAGIIATLASIVESRSLETGQHIKRMCMYVKVLLENISANFPEYPLDERRIEIIMNAASLHDIGKIAIPDAVLNKPGRLNTEEFAIMKTHTTKGCEILDSLNDIADREYLQYAYNICRYHHERWDGRGYPDGLRGDAIPICAQAGGIADCFDALTTDRVYKKAIPPQIAINMILNGECGTFSPKLLESLKAVQSQFVELAVSYSDSAAAPAASSLLQSQEHHFDGLLHDIQHSDSQKYFALLNYIKATVVEADLATGTYQMVYQYNSDFELLKSGGSFEDAVRRFVAGAVHPDDREQVLLLLGSYSENFFSEGLLQTQRHYRIYNHATGQYHLWQASMLRINPDAPGLQKVLLLWRRQEESSQPDIRRKSLAEEILLQNMIVDVQQCRNDRWFTMPEVSHGLLDLLRYNAAEVQARFHNRFIELIHPDDREKVLQKAVQQQRRGSFQEMEYRIVCKDDEIKWLLEKSQLAIGADGLEYYYSVLIDITRSKRTEEALHVLSNRYQIVMEQTSDIIFEWRADTDDTIFSSAWCRHFGYAQTEHGAVHGLGYTHHIFSEDVPAFEDLMARLNTSTICEESEMRIRDSAGRYRWCRFRMTALRAQDGTIVRVIGLITDIDTQKKALQQLTNLAERDSLTQLYNKKVARQKIDDYIAEMQPADSAAMFVIDVDDFKRINDRYGHMVGDTVLQKIASELGSVFRSNDIVARIGGDEFLAFMVSVHDVHIIEERALRINRILQNIIVQTVPDHSISCSIGLVLCPQSGGNFDELFIHGDLALYDAKHRGKNKHSFYQPNMNNFEFEVSADTILNPAE